MVDNKQISKFFFKPARQEDGTILKDYWECKYCTFRPELPFNQNFYKNQNGWTNLANHVKHMHKDYEKLMKQNQNSQFVIPPEVISMHGWIEWIVKKNLPFSFIQDELTRKNVNETLMPTCTNTLQKYMGLLTVEVEKELRDTLPVNFGIIFDGWSEGSDHYVAIFACYHDGEKTLYPLLAFQPIPDYNGNHKNNI